MQLPYRAVELLREVREHKSEIRRHREQAQQKAREAEAICNALGIEFKRSIRRGTAQGHSQDPHRNGR